MAPDCFLNERFLVNSCKQTHSRSHNYTHSTVCTTWKFFSGSSFFCSAYKRASSSTTTTTTKFIEKRQAGNIMGKYLMLNKSAKVFSNDNSIEIQHKPSKRINKTFAVLHCTACQWCNLQIDWENMTILLLLGKNSVHKKHFSRSKTANCCLSMLN